jgi:hypothetical protein
MKKIKFICAQPAIKYYAWQVEVMINSFLEYGIEQQAINIICSIEPNTELEDEWLRLNRNFTDVSFYFYEDTRISKQYVSSIRPHILKKHFKQYPHLKNEIFLYHDCDVVLTQPVNFSKFLDDNIWYASDTKSYIGAKYIKSKEYNIYEEMCNIVGIDKNIPEENQENSGGAQYIMKNVDYIFWEKVENDSEKLFSYFIDKQIEYPVNNIGTGPDKYHPIQMWTADMWAVLWNAWLFGHIVKVDPYLEFAWPTQPVNLWESCVIFHNSGVEINNPHNMFVKYDYMDNFPYNIKNTFNKERCTHLYVNEILKTAKKTCLL